MLQVLFLDGVSGVGKMNQATHQFNYRSYLHSWPFARKTDRLHVHGLFGASVMTDMLLFLREQNAHVVAAAAAAAAAAETT